MAGPRQEVELEPRRVAELHDGGRTQLVDVREPYEWAAGRIAGARHVEMQDLAAQATSLDREHPVVFYCRVGARSGMAAQAFRRAGYDAYNLAGGLEAWVAAGLPLEPHDGKVAPH